MKKILLILLILFLGAISFLLFHDKGNEYLKPYLATYLETKLDNNMSVVVDELKIDLDHVEFSAVLNKQTEVKAQGELSLLSRTLDIDYTLKSDGFKTFDNKVDINGTVTGAFSNLQVQGKGETLKSHIDYALNVKDDVINNIRVNINRADIASLLELASQPAYATGKIDVDINIPTLEEMDSKGKAKIVLHSTTLNEKVFQKELKIDLPKNTIVTANIDSKVSADAFELEGVIDSNLASLKLSQTTYDLNSQVFLTNYALSVPKLSKLLFLTKQKLNGKLQLNGKFTVKKDAYSIKGQSNSLEGKSSFNFNGKKLEVDMRNIEIAKLLHLVNQKPYASGKLMSKIRLSDLKNLAGTFKIATQEAKTINATLKKEMKINFGKAIDFSLNSEGNIKSDIVTLKNQLTSDIVNYYSNDMQYELKNATLSSTYQLDIPKLSKLNALAGKALKGSLAIHGEMNYQNSLNITGSTNSLGGDINFKLANKKLIANINNVSVEKLMHTLSYPQVFKALLVGDFNYDLVTQKGTFTSKLNNAQLLSNQLTVLVQQIRGFDLTKERYTETKFNAKLNKNIINIDFKAKSKTVLLEIPSGRINKVNNSINANYLVKVENKDVGGKIKGNISKPKVTIDSSNYIKEKVIDVIKNNISEDTLKKLGLDKIEADALKDTVNNFLGDLFK